MSALLPVVREPAQTRDRTGVCTGATRGGRDQHGDGAGTQLVVLFVVA